MKKKIRVLVVDDSLVIRELIAKGISSNPKIEVVATASDPFDARDKIIRYEPDVMTCDIEMPLMNGIEFLRRLLPQYYLPVVVVSTIGHAVLDALAVGAVDFIEKPKTGDVYHLTQFMNELISKIQIASVSKQQNHTVSPVLETKQKVLSPHAMSQIIAIGASTGGTEAIFHILKKLPKDFPGILITQHIPPIFSRLFAERLNDSTHLYCKEASIGDIVLPGKVLIAPGGQHMRLKKNKGMYQVEVFEGDRVNGHCPSIDIMFESVAKVAKDQAVGIILTGMGNDGAKGLLAMRDNGARTIGQDKNSSVVYGMPNIAHQIGAVELQCSLDQISQTLVRILGGLE